MEDEDEDDGWWMSDDARGHTSRVEVCCIPYEYSRKRFQWIFFKKNTTLLTIIEKNMPKTTNKQTKKAMIHIPEWDLPIRIEKLSEKPCAKKVLIGRGRRWYHGLSVNVERVKEYFANNGIERDDRWLTSREAPFDPEVIRWDPDLIQMAEDGLSVGDDVVLQRIPKQYYDAGAYDIINYDGQERLYLNDAALELYKIKKAIEKALK